MKKSCCKKWWIPLLAKWHQKPSYCLVRARGDVGADSDVDLLVVETEPFSPQRSRRKETARLYMALRDSGVSKDILLYSRDEFDHWKTSLNHVVGRAHREGWVLHGRS
jgi:hypothetical protein